MRIARADIGHAPELHKLYFEYLQDTKAKRFPNPDFWFHEFRDPTFFCLYMKHGKKKVGFMMGRVLPYYERPIGRVEVFFVRRGFKNMKFIRALYVAGKRYLTENGSGTLIIRDKRSREREICLE